jgi:hypothetical protein
LRDVRTSDRPKADTRASVLPTVSIRSRRIPSHFAIAVIAAKKKMLADLVGGVAHDAIRASGFRGCRLSRVVSRHLLGHRDSKMTDRYTHLSDAYRRNAVQNLPASGISRTWKQSPAKTPMSSRRAMW